MEEEKKPTKNTAGMGSGIWHIIVERWRVWKFIEIDDDLWIFMIAEVVQLRRQLDSTIDTTTMASNNSNLPYKHKDSMPILISIIHFNWCLFAKWTYSSIYTLSYVNDRDHHK